MDREFIEKNQIVERYLAGKLPFKGAQDFERYCRENPDVLEEIRLGDRLHAGMRLLEAGGRPAGWQEAKLPWWRRNEFAIGLAAFGVVLLIGFWILGVRYADRGEQITALEEQLEAGPLHAPARTRTIRVVPERSGPTSRPALVLQLKESAELIELHVDVAYARQKAFRLIIDKKNQARAGTIYNVLRDSNGELRFAVNTSALTPGDYKVAIEGVPFRGNPVRVGWLTIRVVE